ncbi:hypothetical protein [Pedobacter psychrodurus]|uniref:hypothetical protein n=1 Tax=Pedobacter psychrodurus TaxID=2530456 RepID=UPI00292DC3D2|nr:hypothetical protein [Pedobacter psychrodurus]
MKIKGTLLFIIILLGANINLFSQALTGCGKNSTGVIHYQRNGFGSGAGNEAKFKYNNIHFRHIQQVVQSVQGLLHFRS